MISGMPRQAMLWVVMSVAAWATSGTAETAAATPIPAGTATEATLSFDGHASVGAFIGTTKTVSGEMSGGPDISAVRGWVESPVNTLKTGNDRRDRDLLKSMEADKYPNLRFGLDGVTPTGTGESVPVTLKGRLMIHGVEQTVELPGWVVVGSGGAHVHSDFPLNLKDYKIGGLSKMMGVLRMYEDIKVHVDVTFRFSGQ
jgi:polyisoprenoid-binding protein YceI